jgi:hypothetical protein
MSTLVSTLQDIMRDEMRTVRLAELGVVEKTYPHADGGDDDNYGCDVRLPASDLLLKRVPVSTGHIGTAAIPNVGDMVLLIFQQGDINQPIIIGRLYNDTERPPVNHNDEIIFRLPLQKDDNKTVKAAIRNIKGREILIEMPSKITVQILDDTVKVVTGQTEMILDQPGGADGLATISSGRSKISLKQDGDITIEAAGNINIKTSTGDVTIEGLNVSIKSTANTSIDAKAQASVKGLAGATVDGSINATLKGALVSINGTTMFSPG